MHRLAGVLMTQASDETLMQRYAQGERPAFDELFRRYATRAFDYFLRRTRSSERSADLHQELFLRIHRFRATYQVGGLFSAWFFQIANRVLVDDANRLLRFQWSLGHVARLDVVEDTLAEHVAVRSIMALLSSEQRQVIWAVKVDGMHYQEVAARLGKSVESLRQLTSRALRRLRAQMVALETE